MKVDFIRLTGKLAFAIGLGLVSASGALAQNLEDAPRGWGYGFVGGGWLSRVDVGVFQAGAGGEARVARGFAIGGEGSYLTRIGVSSARAGILSVNGSYHFMESGGNLAPFVTAGYSVALPFEAPNAVNYGGGVTYWARPRVGVRLEVRNHHFVEGGTQLIFFRGGVTFR